jgi:23S rRNA pseudouridine955/2504/2580 synthase
MNEINFFLVDKDNEGRRLDNFLFSNFKKNIPKSKIYSSIRKAKIKVNGKKSKPDYKLLCGDKVGYPELVQKADLTDSPNLNDHLDLIKSSIVYDSKNFVVINKPPNYAVHGGSGLNFGVIEIIRKIYKYSENFNLAHRIDKSTSGCLVVAKKMSALRDIHKQFRDRSVKKTYECIVKGAWPEGLKKISNALDIKKTNVTEQKTVKTEFGKKSLTKFYIEEKMEGFTRIKAIPHTGRKHQIRFHCLDAGYPIIGDKKYFMGNSKSDAHRLMLHAREITFKDSEESVTISAFEDFGLSEFKTNI